MRQVFSRLVGASGLLLLACATAEEPLAGDIGDDQGGSTSHAGSVSTAGSTSSAGTLPSAGTTSSSAGTSSSSGGKGGSGPTAFGGTSTTGGAKGGSGGSASGGASAGTSSGGKAGSASGGSATAGTGSGGTGTAGTGTGTAGATSPTCNGVTNWSSKTYAIGDTVASVCSGVFAGSCPSGQSHKFECNPGAGAAALPWCQSREPGVGNGWSEAWVDKGACQ